MSFEETLNQRIESLIDDATRVGKSNEYGQALGQEHMAECRGWIASALHSIELACSSPNNAYRSQAAQIANNKATSGFMIPQRVKEIAAILGRLKSDIDVGLLVSLTNRVRAETYDDFLDHAEAYWKEGRKNESGAIAGIVFEDTVRQISRVLAIEENQVKLDELISELVKAGDWSGIKAKRARAAAGLRTSAAHARWDEFELDDVKPVIDLSRELISIYLDK